MQQTLHCSVAQCRLSLCKFENVRRDHENIANKVGGAEDQARGPDTSLLSSHNIGQIVLFGLPCLTLFAMP